MFSVVMAVRDKPHTIASTLQSVLAQTFTHFELTLVGDPGDSSLCIAASISDPRIRICHQPNIGQGPARNAGIEASRGDWIAFLDADDLWLPNHLAELDSIRRFHPEAGLIGTHFIDTDLSGTFDPADARVGSIARIDYFREVGLGAPTLFTSSAAIGRAAFDRVGGFSNDHFGEDSLLWARIAMHFPVAVSTRGTVLYRHGTGGITDTGRDRWNNLDSVSDLSPPVAWLVERYGEIGTPERRRSVDLFIRRYFDWCLRTSIAIGDYRTVRRLRLIYWGRPTAAHSLLLAIGLLPEGLAAAAYGLGFRIKALMRLLSPVDRHA